MNHTITLFDAIETIAALMALWCLLFSKQSLYHSSVARLMVVLLLANNVFHGVGNLLEYTIDFTLFDQVSDYLKVLQPVAWGILLYAIIQQQTQKELQVGRKRFQDLVESTSDWVWESDSNFVITYSSPRSSKLIGFTSSEILGKTIYDLMDKEEGQRIRQFLEGISTSQQPFTNLESSVPHKNGQVISLESSGVPYFNEWGKLCGYRGINRDITKRKKVELELGQYRLQLEDRITERTEELRLKNQYLEEEIVRHRETMEAFQQSEKRYQVLFEGSQDGLVLLEEGHITECNQKTLELFGYDRQTFIGKTPLCISPQQQPNGSSSLDLCSEHQEKALAGEEQFFEWVYCRNDGTLFIAEVSLHALTIGEKTLLLASVRDITERKHMEEELFKVQKLESTGILAGGIAHDFNNLLTGIMGNVSLAKSYLNPDDQAYIKLEETEKASLRAKALTQQLLTFSKGGKPIVRPMNLAGIISDSARFILSGSNVTLDYSASEDLFPVNGDEGQISQVIQNLATNAAQAIPEGGVIRILADNVHFSSTDAPIPLMAGNYVHLQFIDKGRGIDRSLQGKIFDPFFTTKKKGSGLGLAVAYSIISNHHGLLSVDSEPGKGTTFHVYIPAIDSMRQQTDSSVSPVEHHGNGHILVMDDEEIVVQTLSDMLDHFGYEVDAAYDGAEALEIYEKAQRNGEPYRAVIMDLTIPGGIGGQQAVQELLSLDRDAVVLVASGYANDPIMADYKRFGFKGILTKPFSLSALGEALESVLSNN